LYQKKNDEVGLTTFADLNFEHFCWDAQDFRISFFQRHTEILDTGFCNKDCRYYKL
uniref:Radical SAM protein n=1 Tax=Brugia timori TaxID=42155 RepID=A0A0R3QC94_9BILA